MTAKQRRRVSTRTLEGYRVEYETAVAEGKLWAARKVRSQALRLAAQTPDQVAPAWLQGWNP